MYSFRVVETFTAAPLNMVSGINDMELVEQGGQLMLYTATRGGGGIMAVEVGAAMTLADLRALASGTTLPAPAQVELLSLGGVPHLVVTGPNAGGVQTFGVGEPGTISTAQQLPGGLSGVISAQAVVEIGGTTYLYLARAGESTVHAFSVGPTGTLTAAGTRVLDRSSAGIDITSLSAVTVGGETYLVSLSLAADVIRTFPLGPGGAIGQPRALGTPQGLGVADPAAVSAVEIGGTSFLIMGSTGSSSISVIEVSSGGAMRVADHVIDTLDTRFAGVRALATVEAGDRVFVIAGGNDGGLALMTLMPDGRLLLAGDQLDLPGLALDSISAMTAHIVGDRIEVFVASEGAGITRLEIDLGPLAPIQTASPADAWLAGTTAGDLLVGQDGNETISGGDGADILADGPGRDTLSGGAGADIHVLCADDEIDVITDFQIGIDRIDLTAWGRIYALEALSITATATGARITYGSEILDILTPNGLPIRPESFRLTDFVGLWHVVPTTSLGNGIFGTVQADHLTGTAGTDVFVVSDGRDTLVGGAGFDILDLSFAFEAQQVNLTSSRANRGLTEGQTHLEIEGILGSRFSDQLIGNAAHNWLDGGGGNDRLVGAAGNDSLHGSLGNDFLYGGDGADLLDGGAGVDHAGYSSATTGVLADLAQPSANLGEAAGDRYVGIEALEGSDHADTLRGDAQDNQIFGGNGDDRLEGRDGNDAVFGGNGNDTLFGGAGADTLNGDSGINIASYADSAAALQIDLADPTRSTGDARGDRYRNLHGIEGSTFSDSLSGGTANDRFWGIAGNDRLCGLDGDDWLSGGEGNDSLFGGAGKDTLSGGIGADRVDGGLGHDVASYLEASVGVVVDLTQPAMNRGDARGDVLVGIEELEGSSHADTLLGDKLANRLSGGSGNDRIAGRAQGDSLAGGEGDDTLIGGAGNDVLDGGGGSDWASWADMTSGIVADLADWTRSTGWAAQDRVSGIENLIGTAFGDRLLGDSGSNQLVGWNGNDRLWGREGADWLDGGSGQDWLDGGSGADTLVGGDGHDSLWGSAGGDQLDGGSGNDVLDGGTGLGWLEGNWLDGGLGNDRLIGGAGADSLWGGPGDDRLAGGEGADAGYGGNGNDRLDDGAGDDRLDGGHGNDTLRSGIGSDRLDGGAGNDQLFGGDGTDMLYGGGGNDRLYGGPGRDSLSGGNGTDVLIGGEDNDRLEGGAGNDRLDGGAGDDALLGGPGADAFVFVGGNDTLLDFTNGQDRIWLEADLWGGTPPPVSRLLAGATLTDTGIILTLGFGATLDIRGIFDTRLLMDDFQFI